jgi:hypothetical protein
MRSIASDFIILSFPIEFLQERQPGWGLARPAASFMESGSKVDFMGLSALLEKFYGIIEKV